MVDLNPPHSAAQRWWWCFECGSEPYELQYAKGAAALIEMSKHIELLEVLIQSFLLL